MANVRRAVPDDLEVILTMGRAMHAESPRYRDKAWDEEKVAALVANNVREGANHGWFIAEDAQGVVGMAVVFAVEYFFGRERYVSDLVVYVAPQHRGSSAAFRLVKAVEEWAFSKDINAREVLLGISTGTNTEQAVCVYEKLGYTMASQSLAKANPNV